MNKDNGNISGHTGNRYWKSLDELKDSTAFRDWLEREFPEGASMLDGVERRGFMKVMAASFGLAGFGITGCRRPEQAIMPYGRSPEEIIPGIPNYYSTSLPSPHGNVPLIVECHQARPTKVEGNSSYVPNGGTTNVHAQATLLDLYDPDRAQGSYRRTISGKGENKSVSWAKVSKSQVEKELGKLFITKTEDTPKTEAPTDTGETDKSSQEAPKSSNGKVAFLAEKSFSPSRAKLAAKLQEKGAIWAEYEAIDLSDPENALAEALGAESGLRPLPQLDNAQRILSLDCDFLGTREPDHLRLNRDYSQGRRVLNANDARKMNRLYAVESDLTLTGASADHRLRLGSSQMVAFANALAAELLANDAEVDVIANLKKRGAKAGVPNKWLSEAAKDLAGSKGEAIVLAGSHLPPEAHILVYAINQSLGANGKTINYTEVASDESVSLQILIKAIEAGEVSTLVFIGGNPAYSAPGNLDWESLTKKVKNTLRFGPSIDETSGLADLHVGASHYLESWADGLTWDQSAYVPVQPLISPLFDTYSELDFLAKCAGVSQNAHTLVQETHGELSGGTSFEDFLRTGILEQEPSYDSPSLDLEALSESEASLPKRPGPDSLEVLLVPDFHTWDGRYANNGWMQECPDPMSKLTWDNAILISPVLAKELEAKHPNLSLLPTPTGLNKNGAVASDNAIFNRGKQDAPVVRLKINADTNIEGPLYVQPGLADYSLVATLGMGRKNVGRVGEGCGYNAYGLLSSDGSRIVTGVKLEPTSGRRTLANVQEHWSMEGRAIVREATVDEYRSDTGFAAHMGSESHSPPIYGRDQDKDLKFKAQTTPRGNSSYEHPDHTYENSEEFGLHQWGMTIDLNLCTGCNACVVACQSENNIPVVGKDQVLRGREMHWIRLDRYFSSTKREEDPAEIPSDVQVSFQGVACMHCETAPCESVCPVNATVHDEEGLNAMAYNRCVGTRYCANNCPYKVRRFNFFDWNKRAEGEYYMGPLGDENPALPTMGNNPDVTVRMRGVMEKCTYCVQRIQEAKIRTKVNAQRNKKLSTGKDGEELQFSKSELKVPDGTIRTACQQVCPSEAIVFGDISDPESDVSKLKNNPRDYSVLGYLETRPRTTYLARVRNPNPAMPDAYKQPHSSREYHDRSHPHHDDQK